MRPGLTSRGFTLAGVLPMGSTGREGTREAEFDGQWAGRQCRWGRGLTEEAGGLGSRQSGGKGGLLKGWS